MLNDSIPRSWLTVQLGDIVEYGKAEKCEFSDVSHETWVLELEDIEKGSSKIIKRLDASERPFKSTKNKFTKGDVLYGKLRPYLSKVVLADDDGVCSTEIVPLNSEPFVDNRYLFYWLKCQTFLNYAKEVSYGVNMPRLGTKDGLSAPFILPPLSEQKVISDKLDTFLAGLEKTKDRLKTVLDTLKSFRQSVLAAAVSGKLIGKRVVKKLNLNNCVDILNGSRAPISAAKRQDIQGDIPYYGATGVIDYLNDFTHDGRFLLVGEDGANLLSKSKDLAFIASGKIWVNNHAHVLKEKSGFSLDFIKVAINSLDLSPWVTGSAQPKLTKKSLGTLPIPDFSYEEQMQIVHRVGEAFLLADGIENKVLKGLDRVNSLTESILSKAFCGELTSSWRSSNHDLTTGERSAEALLERIKEERKLLKKSKNKRKLRRARAKPIENSKKVESKSVLGVILKQEKILPQQLFDELKDVSSLQEILSEVSDLLKRNKIKELNFNSEKYWAIKE